MTRFTAYILTFILLPLPATSAWATGGFGNEFIAPQAEQDAESAVTEPAVVVPKTGSTELSYLILAGELAADRGLLQEASQHYQQALQLTDDPKVAARATQVAVFAEDRSAAQKAAAAWVKAAPENILAREAAVRVGIAGDSPDSVQADALAFVQLHPEGREEGLRALARILSEAGQHRQAALELMQSLVDHYQRLPAAHYALGVLALRLQQPEQAARSAERALELDPGWHDATLLHLSVLIQTDRVKQADQVVDDYAGDSQQRTELRTAYARLLLNADRREASLRQFRHILEQDDENVAAHYALGLLALDMEDYETAREHFEALYENEQRTSEVAFYLGGIAENQDDYETAYDWYDNVQRGQHATDARLRAAYVAYRLDRLDEARQRLARMRREQPEFALRAWLLEGELLYEAEQYQEALTVYDRALEDYPRESEILYARSIVNERLNRVTAAEQDLRTIMNQNPNNSRALNALGYMLSNHSMRYEEAKGYIEQALKLTPEDPAVIDSMGWINYRLGNLETALEYLQRAHQQLSDPEVAAHLGEVLWKLGRQEQAREVWQSALTEDPDHPVLVETVDRLSK